MRLLKGIIAVILLAVFVNIWAASTTVIISWTAPATRENGDVLVLSEIDGYRIYYGTQTGNYPNTIIVSDFTATEYIITYWSPGTYYIVLTTIDTNGRESQYSPEIIITIDPYLAPPKPITNLILSVGLY